MGEGSYREENVDDHESLVDRIASRVDLLEEPLVGSEAAVFQKELRHHLDKLFTIDGKDQLFGFLILMGGRTILW